MDRIYLEVLVGNTEQWDTFKIISEQSKLEWTIVCPTYLPDGERLGKYRTESNYLPEGGIEISVSDTAECG